MSSPVAAATTSSSSKRSPHPEKERLGRDKILDFDVGDRIDIDDISKEFEDEFEAVFDDPDIRKFVLIAQGQEFTKPGEVRFKYDEDIKSTVLEGNIDRDSDVEFEIEIFGIHDFRYDKYFYTT